MSRPGEFPSAPERRDAGGDVQESQESQSVTDLAAENLVGAEMRVNASTNNSPQACTTASAITYQYITFETLLPLPNTTIRCCSPAISQEAPSELDLRPFTNPTKWTARRKAYHLVLCCVATLLTAYCAGSYSPPVALMMAEFHASRIAVTTGITTFCTGFALAPMVLAPFSEINGRYPVFAVSGVIFVVFQIVCGLVDSLAGMLVARFVVGVGGSVFSTMIGGVIADLWEKETRNTPMALFSGSVLVGTGLGPLASAVMVYRFNDDDDDDNNDGEKWKWVFWHQAVMGGVLMILMVIFFKESRGSVVLSRKARALNRWYEAREEAGYCGVWLRQPALVNASTNDDDYEEATTGLGQQQQQEEEEKGPVLGSPRERSVDEMQLVRLRWRVRSDEERASLGKMISISVYRPFHLLVTEPVVFSFSLWVSFAWAVLYLTFSSVPYVYETVYRWNIEKAGYVFGAMVVGALLSTVMGIWQDELLKHPQWRAESWPTDNSDPLSCNESQSTMERTRFYAILHRHFPTESPESRLYFACVTATLLPLGLFIFGFTSVRDISWVLPAIAICLATMGIYSIYLATFNYLADVYHMYASSALAAQSCCRNILGGVFPLVTLPLFENLGNARAGGLLGGIALVLTFVPWVLVFFGPRIRARSSFAVNLEKTS